MKFYLLEPEVAGGIGENSLLTYEGGKIKEVLHLNYYFDGWLGDDLLASNPCFIVTKELANELLSNALTGFEIKDVEISTSDTFKDLYPNKTLPEFKWLVPHGVITTDGNCVVDWSGHDICRRKSRLVISEKAIKVIKEFNLNYCDISEYILIVG